MSSDQSLSKRAQKRLAKQQEQSDGTNESNEAVLEAGNGSVDSIGSGEKNDQELTSSIPADTPTSILGNVQLPSFSTSEINDRFMEHSQKRIRNLQKRKQRLDKYQAMVGVEELNDDQLAALKNKEAVEAPLKELIEAQVLHKQQMEYLESQIQDYKIKVEIETNRLLKESKAQSEKESGEKIELLVKFLRAASFKRQLASNDDDPSSAEINGFERLLELVYSGDEVAVKAIDNLNSGLQQPVDKSQQTITFAEVKSISLLPLEQLIEPPKQNGQQNGHDPEHESSSSSSHLNGVSHVSLANISFLHETEDEESDQEIPESQEDQEEQDDETQKKQQEQQEQRQQQQQSLKDSTIIIASSTSSNTINPIDSVIIPTSLPSAPSPVPSPSLSVGSGSTDPKSESSRKDRPRRKPRENSKRRPKDDKPKLRRHPKSEETKQ